MGLIKTTLQDVYIFEPNVYGDHRGFFMETYNQELFAQAGINVNFIQDNHAMSAEVGTLRGLHFQLEPYAQSKLVRVIRGAVYDVIVDLREGSPTYGQWEGFTLSAENKRQLFVPQGFAHGYCTLEKDTEFVYKVDSYYAPNSDRGLAWNDTTLNIDWPTTAPILSDKDTQQPLLRQLGTVFTYKGEGQ